MLLASTDICRRQNRSAQANAVIECRADFPAARSNDPYSVFPSMAMHWPRRDAANVSTQACMTERNSTVSSRANTRLNVSWLGTPYSNVTNWRNHSRLLLANRSTSAHPWAPQSVAVRAKNSFQRDRDSWRDVL